MRQELDVAIHNLESGFHQVSFIHPIHLKRVRYRFRVLGKAKEYVSLVRSQFSASGLNPTSNIRVFHLLKIYFESNQLTQMRRLGLPILMSFVESFGEMAAMDVRKENLLGWIEKIRTEREFAGRSMENVRGNINPFFEFLVDAGVLPSNPLRQVVIPRAKSREKHEKLTESEVEEVLWRVQEASPTLIYPVVYFLAHTGCRLGEARNLKWSDIDFDSGMVCFRGTKNGDDRFIQMSSQANLFLASHPHTNESVFVSANGGTWKVPQYRKLFQEVRKKVAYKKHWTNHGFRHSFAFNYLRQGGDMRQLQHILGHRKLQMTVDLYGKIKPKDIEAGSPFEF